ncbi:MAG: glycine cleavage system protein R [Egibacteraceae bacterium]
MADLAVTTIGADQPGIIARVTGVLLEVGGNIEDSSMTVLRGQFAIVLLVSADVEPARLETALAEATADLELFVSVREVHEGHRVASPTHVVSVYGADRPGIVHEVAQELARHEVNVTDLRTQVLGADVYAMLLEVALPAALDDEELAVRLRAAAAGLEVTIRPLDQQVL